MNYKEMKKTIEQMANESHRNYVKALISFEKGINDEEILDKIYEDYMNHDNINLISDDFDYMIEELSKME